MNARDTMVSRQRATMAGDAPPPAAVSEYAAALREARDRFPAEPALIAQARDLTVALAAREAEWLTDAMCAPDTEQGFGVHLVHEEDDHALAAFVVSWLPGRGTPPHDHGSWAVVVGLRGCEHNRMWHRLDDRSRPGHAVLAPAPERAIAAGDVVAMPSGAIHSVRNAGDAVSVSLHVYAMHFNFAERSQYDPEARTEMPYRVRVSA